VDDQEGIKDPVGMSGIRLEVETHIVTVGIQPSKNLKKVMNQAGVLIDDEIAAPLASAKSVAKKRQKDLGCAVVDIGAATTGIAVYEDGEVLFTDVLPIGGMHITNDIAIGLRTSIDIAEKVKIKFGHARKKDSSEKGKIDLSEIDIKEEGTVTERHVAEIIEARIEEILKMVREKLKTIEREALLPAGIILTGGTSKLPGIEEKAKEVLKLPTEVGKPHNLFGMTEKVYDPTYSTVIGLLLYNFEELSFNKPSVLSGGTSKVTGTIKKIFKTFLP
jgi:cell division protein FtsA